MVTNNVSQSFLSSHLQLSSEWQRVLMFWIRVLPNRLDVNRYILVSYVKLLSSQYKTKRT